MKKTILVSIALCSISSSNAGSVKLFAAASLSNTLTEIAQIDVVPLIRPLNSVL
ncbi:hypothetical protein F972_00409 [Acinetobacter sp. CIP 102529]|nr:hypothetical protein F972_00409 [Acinetobacter sp. CIP 102529]